MMGLTHGLPYAPSVTSVVDLTLKQAYCRPIEL